MSRVPHTPIYTRRDLAQILAKHEREHPDHDTNCPCGNGIIATLRTYFAPTKPTITKGPPPYIPPDVQPPLPTTANEVSEQKPWLKQRDGEAKTQYHHRINHSCYNCGHHIPNTDQLDQHETSCTQQGRRAMAADDE